MHMTTSESGVFTCFATNDVGKGKSNSIIVDVKGGKLSSFKIKVWLHFEKVNDLQTIIRIFNIH